MVTDFNNSKDLWSTGSKAKDILGGLAIGLGNINNRPGDYYVQANYKGSGLANTGLGYIQNQNYQNPYDQAALLTSMLSGDKKQTLQDKLGIQFQPTGIDFRRPYTAGDYSLPTQDYDYNTGWLYSTPRQYVDNNPISLGQGYTIPQSLGFLNR